MKSRQLIIASLVFASVSVSNAAWVAVDNFESLSTGAIGGQGGWTSGGTNAANAKVDVDPTNVANKVLFIDGNTAGASKAIPSILNGTTGTFFFRVYAANTGAADLVFGLSDITTPTITNFGDLEAQSGILTTTAPDPDLRARDGGSNQTPGTAMTNGVWYNVWMVVDNTNDNWRFLVEGGAYATQTELFSSTAGNTDWDFRNGAAANDLTSFFVYGNNGSSGSKIYFDDLYVDASGQNLLAAVPEPSVALLGGISLIGLLRRRRA